MRSGIALPYVNLYIGNDCVIVPLACLPCDREGLARLGEVFPDREVGVPATNLVRRGGGPHCITLQQPRV